MMQLLLNLTEFQIQKIYNKQLLMTPLIECILNWILILTPLSHYRKDIRDLLNIKIKFVQLLLFLLISCGSSFHFFLIGKSEYFSLLSYS